MSDFITVALGAATASEATPATAPDLRLSGEWPLTSAIDQVAQRRPDASHAVFYHARSVVLPETFGANTTALLARLAENGLPWLYAAAAGDDLFNGASLNAIYSADTPRLSGSTQIRPISVSRSDPILVNLTVYRGLRPKHPTADINELARHGYAASIPSFYAPHLGASVVGRSQLMTAETEFAPLKLSERALMQARLCDSPSISIVTRTAGSRPHLLRRLGVSIVRSLRAFSTDVEWLIVGGGDAVGHAQSTLADLNLDEFVKVQFVHQELDGLLPDRVANLVAGVRAASNDYVWFIDDDDFLIAEAFALLDTAFCLGQRPTVVLTSAMIEERWEFPPRGKPVVASVREIGTYESDGWRYLFRGWNSLPICSVVSPRESMAAVLEGWELSGDLSEDYFMFLKLFSREGTPTVVEVTEPTVGISIRPSEGSNTVTFEDRTSWLSHISASLTDVLVAPGTGARWQLLTSLGADAADRGPVEDTVASVMRLENLVEARQKRIEMLSAELLRLRKAPATQSKVPAVKPPPPSIPYRLRRKIRHLMRGGSA